MAGTATMKFLLLSMLLPILISLIFYRAVDFDAADVPADYSYAFTTVPNHHGSILPTTETVGEGLLLGPEDLAYDTEERVIYTGCTDGWIRRVRLLGEPVVENWAFVGGRPLGVALAAGGALVVANADKGLMMVAKDGSVRILTDEAEGLRFGLTDGVDVASDGTIYFTDASYKYSLEDFRGDFLEGRPYGRLLSFHPPTNQTAVLLRDLYFANGVALSPDQRFLIFCETTMRRCGKYHIRGERGGTVESFLENTPGFPDNIKYDGNGSFWIGLPAGKNKAWDVIMSSRMLRKIMYMIGKRIEMSSTMRDGGALEVNLEGKPISLYTDSRLSSVTAALRIENSIYLGSLVKPYVRKIDRSKIV